MHPERTRYLAANCKILPPLPPNIEMKPEMAAVYAVASGHLHHG